MGEATALKLSAAGAVVVLVARREDRLQALQKRICDAGGKAHSVVLDIADETATRSMIESVRGEHGRIDILINNAGVMLNGPAATVGMDQWRTMVEVNVIGLMNATHAVLPLMREQGGGHIVNISSVAALNSNPGASVYSASKAAVSVFSDAIRKECAKDGVRVSTISPGAIATELPDHIADETWKANFREWMKTMTPLEAADVADAILYVLTRPAHMCIGEMVIRPTRQER